MEYLIWRLRRKGHQALISISTILMFSALFTFLSYIRNSPVYRLQIQSLKIIEKMTSAKKIF